MSWNRWDQYSLTLAVLIQSTACWKSWLVKSVGSVLSDTHLIVLVQFHCMPNENPDWTSWSQWDQYSLTHISLFSSSSTARWMKTLIWWVEVGGISTLWHGSHCSHPVPMHAGNHDWWTKTGGISILWCVSRCSRPVPAWERWPWRLMTADWSLLGLTEPQRWDWGQLKKNKTHSTNVQDYES